jgi:hypothetical protein
MYVKRSYSSQRGVVYRCEQNLESSLHLSLMALVTQVMRCELVFLNNPQSRSLSLSGGILFLKVHK